MIHAFFSKRIHAKTYKIMSTDYTQTKIQNMALLTTSKSNIPIPRVIFIYISMDTMINSQ